MKKILGILFSLIGFAGTLLAFVAVLALPALSTLTNLNVFVSINVDWIVVAIITGCSLVFYILGKIGIKLDDSGFEQGIYLKFKRTAILILGKIFFNVLFVIVYIFGILGYLILGVAGLTGGLEVNYIDMFVNAGSLLLTLSFAWSLYGSYPERHCPYCGGSFSGGDIAYEEEERSYSVDDKGKVNRTSKIRFEVLCPVCDASYVYRKKMTTNAEKVEKYANGIIK